MNTNPNIALDSLGKLPLLAGKLMLLLGILLALCGSIWIARTGWFVMRATRTTGIITEINYHRSAKGGYVYFPTYAFETKPGLTYTNRLSNGSAYYQFEVGEKVSVLYSAGNPTESLINSFRVLWMQPVILLGVGLVFGGIARLGLFIIGQ